MAEDPTTIGTQGEARQEAPWLSEVESENWRAFIDGTARLNEALARDLEERVHLTLSDYGVLVRLSELPKRTARMSELAQDLSHSRSRMTHTVRRLEARGYVRRSSCDKDGRGVNCVMTRAGFAALKDAAPGHVRAVREFFVDQISPEELALLGSIMVRVANRCGS